MEASSSPIKILNAAVASHYSRVAENHWRHAATSDTVDWYATVNEAFASGLAALLYSSLLQLPSSSIPKNLFVNLRNSYHASAAFNVLAMHNLANVLRTLAAGGISVVLLKGAALLQTVYPDLSLRPMVDLDLLIPYEMLHEATNLLADVGYRQSEPLPFDDESGLIWNELLLINDNENSTQVELHWQLLDNPYYSRRLSVTSLINRAIPCQIEDVKALVLSPDDQILHLSSHNLLHHQGHFRRTAVDVAFITWKYGSTVNWDQLVKQASTNSLVMSTETTLSQASDEWYASVPDDALTELQSLKVGLRERFFVTSQKSEFLKLLRTIVTVPGLSLKWRFLIGQLFPREDFLLWRYGDSGTISKPIAYIKRYTSGLSTLLSEIRGSK